MKKIILLIYATLLAFLNSLKGFAYDIKTHKDITKATINSSVVSGYLQNYLGIFPNDLFKGPAISRNDPRLEIESTYSAFGWMEEGAGSEDEYLQLNLNTFLLGKDMRANNHFYNPFWDSQLLYPYGNLFSSQKGGLSDETVDELGSLSMSYGLPSPNWAYNGNKNTGNAQSQFTRDIGNSWSWTKARQYYLITLTSPLQGNRELYFAMLFRSLGQVMHLIQDAAQPDHTRNDAHPESSYVDYEWYVAENYSALSSTRALDYSTIINSNEPVLDFFDSLRQGEEFDKTKSKGLAEFSSYNFLTEDTVKENLDSDHNFTGTLDKNSYFTHPTLDENRTIIEKGFFDDVLYYYSDPIVDPAGQAPGLSIPLAKRTWHHNLLRTIGYYSAYTTRDKKIWRAKADILLPKAISYSAGLLNYFFRGKINMDKDPNNSSQYVIKNETGENMSGTFSLYYDDAYDNRHLITSWNFSINANSQSSSISFTAPTDPKEKGKYILAFQGTLGSEQGAVVGQVLKLCSSDGAVSISISGPDAPSNGSQYTVTGGVEPYTWSITKGSITQTGVVTVSGQCGTATVVITDICGNIQSKNVNMPGGVWITIPGREYNMTQFTQPWGTFSCQDNNTHDYGEKIIDSTHKYSYQVDCVTDPGGAIACWDSDITDNCPQNYYFLWVYRSLREKVCQ